MQKNDDSEEDENDTRQGDKNSQLFINEFVIDQNSSIKVEFARLLKKIVRKCRPNKLSLILKNADEHTVVLFLQSLVQFSDSPQWDSKFIDTICLVFEACRLDESFFKFFTSVRWPFQMKLWLCFKGNCLINLKQTQLLEEMLECFGVLGRCVVRVFHDGSANAGSLEDVEIIFKFKDLDDGKFLHSIYQVKRQDEKGRCSVRSCLEASSLDHGSTPLLQVLDDRCPQEMTKTIPCAVIEKVGNDWELTDVPLIMAALKMRNLVKFAHNCEDVFPDPCEHFPNNLRLRFIEEFSKRPSNALPCAFLRWVPNCPHVTLRMLDHFIQAKMTQVTIHLTDNNITKASSLLTRLLGICHQSVYLEVLDFLVDDERHYSVIWVFLSILRCIASTMRPFLVDLRMTDRCVKNAAYHDVLKASNEVNDIFWASEIVERNSLLAMASVNALRGKTAGPGCVIGMLPTDILRYLHQFIVEIET